MPRDLEAKREKARQRIRRRKRHLGFDPDDEDPKALALVASYILDEGHSYVGRFEQLGDRILERHEGDEVHAHLCYGPTRWQLLRLMLRRPFDIVVTADLGWPFCIVTLDLSRLAFWRR